MLQTSLQQLFDCGSWIHDTNEFQSLMKRFGKDYLSIDETPLSFESLLSLTNLAFTIDCTSARPDQHLVWRAFSIWCCQPFLYYITVPSCAVALSVAKQFVLGKASLSQLCVAHETASVERLGIETYTLSLEDCANRLSCYSADPSIASSIDNCFNGYALGMGRLGMTFEMAEEQQRRKFIELVSDPQ